MATDRCFVTRSINAPAHVARVLIHARYGFNPRRLVGQGASEASGALGMTTFSADYQSADLAHAAKKRVAGTIHAGAPAR